MENKPTIEQVIHQLMTDWYDRNNRDMAIRLIENIPAEKLEEYMQDVDFD
jgi:hypothetical protein